MRVVLRNSCLALKGTHGFELRRSDMDNRPAAISLVSVLEETKDSVVPDFDLGKHQPVPLVWLLLMVDNWHVSQLRLGQSMKEMNWGLRCRSRKQDGHWGPSSEALN